MQDTQNNLAILLQAEGKSDEAEQILRDLLKSSRNAAPRDDSEMAFALLNLGSLLRQRGKLAEAEPLVRQALELFRNCRPADHPDTISAMTTLSDVLWDQGRLADAEAFVRETLQVCRKVYPDRHPMIVNSMNSLALLLQEQGKYAEAEPLFAELYHWAAAGEISMPDFQVQRIQAGYGPCLTALGRYKEAEEPLRLAYDGLKRTEQQFPDPLTRKRLSQVLAALAEVCDHTSRPAEAAKWRTELASLDATTQPIDGPSTQPTSMPMNAHILLTPATSASQ